MHSDAVLHEFDVQQLRQIDQRRFARTIDTSARQTQVPFLPSTSPHVREMLMRSPRYLMQVFTLNTELQGLLNQAKERGEIRADLPTDVILYAYYARTCDPAVDYMKAYGQYSDDDIVRYMLSLMLTAIQT